MSHNAKPLLSVNNVEVIYNHVILVLKGVSLQVPEGGVVALCGRRLRTPTSMCEARRGKP